MANERKATICLGYAVVNIDPVCEVSSSARSRCTDINFTTTIRQARQIPGLKERARKQYRRERRKCGARFMGASEMAKKKKALKRKKRPVRRWKAACASHWKRERERGSDEKDTSVWRYIGEFPLYYPGGFACRVSIRPRRTPFEFCIRSSLTHYDGTLSWSVSHLVNLTDRLNVNYDWFIPVNST